MAAPTPEEEEAGKALAEDGRRQRQRQQQQQQQQQQQRAPPPAAPKPVNPSAFDFILNADMEEVDDVSSTSSSGDEDEDF